LAVALPDFEAATALVSRVAQTAHGAGARFILNRLIRQHCNHGQTKAADEQNRNQIYGYSLHDDYRKCFKNTVDAFPPYYKVI
jgi:hypothetical protein